MKWKYLTLVSLAAMSFAAVYASSASATTLEVGGSAKNEAVTFTLNLKSGTSLIIKDTAGFSQNTCSEWHTHGTTTSAFFGLIVWSDITTSDYTACTRTITVHKSGRLSFQYTSGTNAKLSSSEAEVTVGSAIGTLTCKTGESTSFGTLTGVSSGAATMDINAVVNCGIIPSSKWEATLSVASPSGLGVVS